MVACRGLKFSCFPCIWRKRNSDGESDAGKRWKIFKRRRQSEEKCDSQEPVQRVNWRELRGGGPPMSEDQEKEPEPVARMSHKAKQARNRNWAQMGLKWFCFPCIWRKRRSDGESDAGKRWKIFKRRRQSVKNWKLEQHMEAIRALREERERWSLKVKELTEERNKYHRLYQELLETTKVKKHPVEGTGRHPYPAAGPSVEKKNGDRPQGPARASEKATQDHKNRMAVPPSCAQLCLRSSDDTNQMVGIKVERATDVEEGREPSSSSLIVTEPANCVDSLKSGPVSCSETCLRSSDDEIEIIGINVEEATDIKEEEHPEPIPFPTIKTEPESTVNDQTSARSGEQPFSCDICNKAFGKKSNLMKHKRVHSGERPFCCNVCNKAFDRNSVLITHERIHSGERPFCCDVCNMAFGQRSHLNSHKMIHSGERPFCCDVCNMAFRRLSTLKRHKCMRSGEQPFSCDVCNKEFHQKNDLMRHKQMHSGERPFCCDVCNMAFRRPSNLKRHKWSHSGERPFCCNVCNKAFSQKSVLITHKRIHSGARPYCCDVCNKTFRQKFVLITHKRIHSGERPFCCDVCNMAFGQRSHLNSHKMIHSGERPFCCDVCNMAFRRLSTLKRHKCMRSGERPFSCDVCNKAFGRKLSLIRHLQIHGGQ